MRRNSIWGAGKGLLGLLALILTFNLWGYGFSQPLTQSEKLKELSRFFAQQLEAGRSQIYYDLLRSEAFPQQRLNQSPDIQLMYINQRGHPVFYMIENLNAAKTISTDDVWPGGSGGFSLSGSGTLLG